MVAPSDHQFLPWVFAQFAQETYFNNPIERIVASPLSALSWEVDASGLQESVSVRNLFRARGLALFVIGENGQIDRVKIAEASEALWRALCSLGPRRENDAPRQAHLLRVLKVLQNDSACLKELSTQRAPTDNFVAQDLIRKTLGLAPNAPVGAKESKQATLCAWLTYLRQSVGSCFATAPAILIQQEEPLQFLRDIQELFVVGRISRTFAGVQYSVPLCATADLGDLAAPVYVAPPGENIAHSPGLLAALVAARVVDGSLPRIGQIEQIMRLLQKHNVQGMTNGYEILKQLVPSTLLQEACDAFRALSDNALLKAWEFTLASFADVKADFSKWNLYSSLGLDVKDPDGLGGAIATSLQAKLDTLYEQQVVLSDQYQMQHASLRQIEQRSKSASEDEMRWLRIEYQNKAMDVRNLSDQLDALKQKSHTVSNLFRTLVDLYLKIFPDYFQEVYDPSLQASGGGRFDDAPAGFRLIYKHGRANSAVWSPIHNEEEFVRYLCEFFTATEGMLQHEIEGIRDEISDLVTLLITHVRTPHFVEWAKKRTKKGATPWSYVSGGTMSGLTATYFGREEAPSMVSRDVQSVDDLLHFLLETLKDLPPQVTNRFVESPSKSLLMHSPTHAFLLKPGFMPFRKGWLDKGNTASWIREQVIRPAVAFYSLRRLDRISTQLLLDDLERHLPTNLRYSFRDQTGRLPAQNLTPAAFRDTLARLPWLGKVPLFLTVVDATLHACLPFCKVLRTSVIDILEGVLGESSSIIFFDQLPQPAQQVSAYQLQQIVQAVIIKATGKASFTEDLPALIRAQMRQLDLAPPAPLVFADTNWVRDYFGFVVNPGTEQLELWRADYLGLQGAPMREWSGHLDGTANSNWTIYSNPFEYAL